MSPAHSKQLCFQAIVNEVFLCFQASNPIYERGASDTLKMASITNRSGENEEEWPEYQPLVENTKPNEQSDSLPGYRALSTGQRPTQGARSSNYLSLIKDDTEEGRNYQTLVKDVDPQVSRFQA